MIHSWNHHYDFSVANLGYTHEEASEYADVNMERELKAAWGPASSGDAPVPWLSGESV